MKSLILQTTTRALQPVLLVYSLFLLLVGHDQPGGGFVAALVASAAIALYGIAYDVGSARRLAIVEPRTVIGLGLLIALASGVWGLLYGHPFMTAMWGRVPGAPGLTLGTPFLFDVGVYVLVVGVTLLMVFSIAEE